MANAGTALFTGNGVPGVAIYILKNSGVYGTSGFVGANGTYAISVGSAGIIAGNSLVATAGSPAGPASNIVIAMAASGTPALPSSPIAGGATVISVIGAPGAVVQIVDPGTQQVVGSGVIGSNGQVGISISPAVATGTTLYVVVGGIQDPPVTVGASGSPPTVNVSAGTTLVDGSVISGTGTPGATVAVVDSSGAVLGSAVVDAQGNYSVTITGVVTGRTVAVVQNGVKAPVAFKSAQLGGETAYLSTNVFKPLQGGTLSIGFKALNDDHITVKIFTLSGALVRPVLDLDVKAGVIYTSSWDGKNSYGETIASGIYFVSVHGSHQSSVKKVIVLK